MCDGTDPSYPECARIFVDVNGIKPPNTWGKDIYWLFLYPNKIVTPTKFGALNVDQDCDPNNASAVGVTCSTLYILK